MKRTAITTTVAALLVALAICGCASLQAGVSGGVSQALADEPAKAATASKDASEDASAQDEASSDGSFTWSESSDCSLCHKKQVTSMTDDDCQISPEHSSLSCFVCHDDVDAIALAHSSVTADDTRGTRALENTEVKSETCLACHAASDATDDAKDAAASDEKAEGDAAGIKAYSAEATEDCMLVDSKDNEVNPHDLPVNDAHVQTTCGNCHAMHQSKEITKTASAYCTSCHHASVFECGTCHTVETEEK